MVQLGEPVSSLGLLAGVWVRGHLQEEEEGLKSRCLDTWMKMESLELAAQLAGNCTDHSVC